ncbi:protein of unknown function [Pseudomonas sp. JV551A1]|uniref:Uncharacterized protein n=1 Tax=Pseudomonas inefficax TaxID=2078786 RepID=A0AAQ1P776_9PSED|nr:hypothetical protein [Pseudomonas]SPO53697.1 protein of unknown function [Pseudomonas sp. JV551A1]SPO59775.1 protein of unknown function [Pseudomonas inefficax]
MTGSHYKWLDVEIVTTPKDNFERSTFVHLSLYDAFLMDTDRTIVELRQRYEGPTPIHMRLYYDSRLVRSLDEMAISVEIRTPAVYINGKLHDEERVLYRDRTFTSHTVGEMNSKVTLKLDSVNVA